MFLKTRSHTLHIGIQHVLFSIWESVKIRGPKFWLKVLCMLSCSAATHSMAPVPSSYTGRQAAVVQPCRQLCPGASTGVIKPRVRRDQASATKNLYSFLFMHGISRNQYSMIRERMNRYRLFLGPYWSIVMYVCIYVCRGV